MSMQLTCPKCGVFNKIDDNKCWKCSEPINDAERQSAIKMAEENTVKESLFISEQHEITIKAARESGDWSAVSDETIEQESASIILTTSYQLAAHNIIKEVGIVTSEVVYGMNIFSDLLSGVRDIVGGRSGAVQNVLKDAKRAVLNELRREALILNSDAVIAINLSYHELTGGGKNGMIMLVASGTAVKASAKNLSV